MSIRNARGELTERALQSPRMAGLRASWPKGDTGHNQPLAQIAMPIEFRANRGILADADEFVRQGFIRVRTGWRREEWAHRPLFICGKFAYRKLT